MPGICGFWTLRESNDSSPLLDEMLARLQSPQAMSTGRHIAPDGRCGLGSVSLGSAETADQPVQRESVQWFTVFDGELYDTGTPHGRLSHNEKSLPVENGASIIASRYAYGGTAEIAEIEGSYCAAIVDLKRQLVTLISDRFGTRPLYCARSAHRFCFASSISALLADPAISRELDRAGIAQFFTFGHYFGDHTSLLAVKVLPAGAILTFDARSNQVRIERYWRGMERIGRRPLTRAQAMEAVDDALVRSVRLRARAPARRIGISLSGGLDARTILGLFDGSRSELISVCMGMAGSREHEASQALAKIVGCTHYKHVLDTRFLSEFQKHLEHMVRLTDGQYLSQCIVMPTLPLYQSLGINVLLRGHAGELLHMNKAYNYSVSREALALKTDATLEQWLWKRLQAYMLNAVEKPLFAWPASEAPQAARESLRSALDEIPPVDSPSQRIAHLFLDQRVRRETMLSMMKFRSVVEPRLPYLDRALVEVLMSMPMEWKLGDDLQTYVLRKHQPQFCRIPNTNTGAILGAGQLRQVAAKLKTKAFSKLGLPGYQPYERLGLWLRHELAECVETLLLSDTCLDRGVFDPDTVRNVVHGHLGGKRNHTYLIMAMMVFEVGLRWLFDRDINKTELRTHLLRQEAKAHVGS